MLDISISVEHHKPQVISLFVLTVSSLIFIIIFSVEKLDEKYSLSIEAEDAEVIIPPLQIFEDDNASGGKGIVSKMISHQTESFARYSFGIPNTGSYKLWARVFWPGGCNNSYKVKVDGHGMMTIGNDNLLDKWHWIECGNYDIVAGNHKLFLWNDEYDARLDKFILTSDPSYRPSGTGHSSEFGTDFEGDWPKQIISKSSNWQIELDKRTGNHVFILNEADSKQKELALIDIPQTGDFSFTSHTRKLRQPKSTSFGLIFGHKNNENYGIVDFSDSINVLSISNAKANLLKSIPMPEGILSDSSFTKLSLTGIQNTIIVKVNGKKLFDLEYSPGLHGKVGIASNGKHIQFDNLDLRNDLEPYFQETFFYINPGRMDQGVRTLDWDFHSGNWHWDDRKLIMSLEGKIDEFNYNSHVTTGFEFWKDYTFSAAVRSPEKVGISFYAQNAHEYLLYRLVNKEGIPSKIQLVKVKNDQEEILKEIYYNIQPEDWHLLTIKCLDDSIYAFVDSHPIMTISNEHYDGGRIGLWCQSRETSYFDDVIVRPSKEKMARQSNYYYDFEMRTKAGMDFCDWTNSNNAFAQVPGPGLAMEKKMFENVLIHNKKVFHDSINIKINHPQDLPKDIHSIIRVTSLDSIGASYDVIFDNDQLILYRNKQKIVEKEMGLIRKSYNLQLKDDIWSIGDALHNENIPLPVPAKFKIGIGFGGIGEYLLPYTDVTISRTNVP